MPAEIDDQANSHANSTKIHGTKNDSAVLCQGPPSPLLLSTSQGYFVNLLRVRTSGNLSRHQHTDPVCATTLKGRWHYLEHDWWAEEGGFGFEPQGETHTLEVPEAVEEMVTLFHVTGAYVYVDPNGKAEKVEDGLSKIRAAGEHCKRIWLGRGFMDQFVRFGGRL